MTSKLLRTALFAVLLSAGPAAADQGRSYDFGLALLERLHDQAAGNVVVSPLSVAQALDMLRQGASAPAREAIAETLGEASEADAGALRQVVENVIAAAADDDAILVFNAAGLWLDHAADVFPAFVTALQLGFGAEVERLSFAEGGAEERINGWVSEATEGLVPAIVDDLSPLTTAVLANAVYFKGKWALPFDPNDTEPHRFTRSDGTEVEVPMMFLDDAELAYQETETWQAVRLPYGSGAFHLAVLVAKPGNELGDNESWLEDGGYGPQIGYLGLPGFEIDFRAALLPVLIEMGLGQVFDDESSFAGIARPAPVLDAVLHRAVVTVSEEGTEAAAATAATMDRSFERQEKFEMIVDRPFLFAVQHAATGALLFIGTVDDPGGVEAAAFAPEVETRDEVLVALKNANVRAGPGLGHERLETLAAGTEVRVTGVVKGADWVRIDRPGGGVGYVFAPLLGTAQGDDADPG
jgi:serpin B